MIDLNRETVVPVKKVAEMFYVHRRTVDGWFDAGLEWIKMRGRVYTTKEALQRFAVHGSQPSRPASTSDLQRDADAASAVLNARWGI